MKRINWLLLLIIIATVIALVKPFFLLPEYVGTTPEDLYMPFAIIMVYQWIERAKYKLFSRKPNNDEVQ